MTTTKGQSEQGVQPECSSPDASDNNRPSDDALADLLTGVVTPEQAIQQHGLDYVVELGEVLLRGFHATSKAQRARQAGKLHAFLNLARQTPLLREVGRLGRQDDWFDLILRMVKASNFTLGKLLRQRAEEYADKCLFMELKDGQPTEHSWRDIYHRIQHTAASLLAYRKEHGLSGPVAILSENSLDMVCLDLACLSVGVINVLIPANSVETNIAFILNHSESTLLFVSNAEQLAKVTRIKDHLPKLHSIVLIDASKSIAMGNVITFNAFMERGPNVPPEAIEAAVDAVQIDDAATYMYTSGTTEASKGIIFSHLNIISKRFARALAMPEIGPDDRFLCYLPLFHTFGRYFEMMGCLFWGATYIFMESPKVETMISNMRQARPTVFISIPKKWMQLFEHICEEVDIDTSPQEKIRETVAHFTGGELRWGLSAAGYLDPDIFRFFQANGVEIMSGFGMTEATGGITMTPPFQYRANSVGKALPGIEIELAEDGEMLIRGPYVMQGYLHSEDTGIDKDGWMCTGDIFVQDMHGFFSIVDRKKEIYKNTRGETIAPQRIENLFQDFDAVKTVFLVGDNRPYNTVIIYPNWDYEQLDLRALSPFKLREFFGSLVVSVNRFLAPYERIINFELIDRDFDSALGELTAKGTFKRKVVERNFKDDIEKMYSSDFVSIRAGHFEIRVPNWFLREKGITATALRYERYQLKLNQRHGSLTIRPSVRTRGKIQIGDFKYQSDRGFIDLSHFIFHPVLWVGNSEFQQFVGDSIFTAARSHALGQVSVTVLPPLKNIAVKPKTAVALKKLLDAKVVSLQGVHLAAHLLSSYNEAFVARSLAYLEMAIRKGQGSVVSLARNLLTRYAASPKAFVRKQTLWVLLITEKSEQFQAIFEQYLRAVGNSLDKTTLKKFVEHNFLESQLKCIFAVLDEYAIKANWDRLNLKRRTFISLLNLITEYGIRHPAAYKSIRTELINWTLIEFDDRIQKYARACVERLVAGFRRWLGKNLTIAVDPETATEYGWSDVIIFEEGIEEAHRQRIFHAMVKYPIIREAIFLFTKGTLVQLQEIAPKGVWVSPLGTLHGKTVYRVSVQTHHFGAFDMAINVNNSLRKEEIASEIDWLICAGALEERHPLVEDFGGYWPEFDLWSEEFIHGDTVAKFLARTAKSTLQEDEDKLRYLWIYLAWSGMSAYVDFWCRTGRRLEIADPTPGNVIVPSHDYQIGFRIISISNRKPFSNVVSMMILFYENFITPVESQYPDLQGLCKWSFVFASFLEILGEKEGLKVLQQAQRTLRKRRSLRYRAAIAAELERFIANVQERGYRPKRLYFAIQRYCRWFNLNPEATARAKMQTLQELHTTYTLADLEPAYPGARVQYFRDTVFAAAEQNVVDALNQIINTIKSQPSNDDIVIKMVTAMTEEFTFSEDEKAFLARMTYQHLGHRDSAEIVSFDTPGTQQAALMTFIADDEGNRYGVRSPANPKEIARLYKLFNSANLPVEFRNEHQYLVALNERSQVIGGLFYRQVDSRHVHLEKIVVDNRFRRKNISDGLMNEFFNRIKSQGARIVTVGFLRPEYFYKFGFKIDQRYGNMVKRFEKPTRQEKAVDMVEKL